MGGGFSVLCLAVCLSWGLPDARYQRFVSAEGVAHFPGNLGHAGRPVLRIGLQHRLDHRPQIGIDAGQVGHGAALFHDLDLRAAHVDRLAAQGGGQHQAEAVDVGLLGDLAAIEAELLGRDVVVLAGELAADQRAAADGRRPRDAEVDDLGALDLAARQDDVVRREVAVDRAGLVGGAQARSQRGGRACARLQSASAPRRMTSNSDSPSTNSMAR